jgi:hypothetical protein
MLGAWPWLRGLPLGADGTDPPVKSIRQSRPSQSRLNAAAIYRNPEYLSWFYDEVRGMQGIFFLGTSETGPLFNLGAQLNDRAPDDPPMVVVPRKGMSPIHSTLTFATGDREGLAVPPLIMIINLVYFTRSHDVINDGWMGSAVRSPVFLYFNHRDVLAHVSNDVRALYDAHFSRWRLLHPLFAQEYVGNLLYLAAHQSPAPDRGYDLPVQRYSFDGTLPAYDEERAVHRGYVASDQLAKGRWTIRSVDACLNLKGLASTAAILGRQAAPVLLLVLPVNRRFYAHNGIDMREFDRRYLALRREIAAVATRNGMHLVDMYDEPRLHMGFMDRMHPDAYGYRQLADYLSSAAAYREFIDAVRDYYVDPPK